MFGLNLKSRDSNNVTNTCEIDFTSMAYTNPQTRKWAVRRVVDHIVPSNVTEYIITFDADVEATARSVPGHISWLAEV